MEKFLVKKRVAKNIFQAKLYLLLFSVVCLSISANLFINLIEENPNIFAYETTQK